VTPEELARWFSLRREGGKGSYEERCSDIDPHELAAYRRSSRRSSLGEHCTAPVRGAGDGTRPA